MSNFNKLALICELYSQTADWYQVKYTVSEEKQVSNNAEKGRFPLEKEIDLTT